MLRLSIILSAVIAVHGQSIRTTQRATGGTTRGGGNWGWDPNRPPPDYPTDADKPCDSSATVCEYDFWITETLPMRTMNNTGYVYSLNGKLYHYTDTTAANPGFLQNEPIIGDGTAGQRIVLGINRTSPGPAIIVHKGQTIKVKLTNTLYTQSTTIHWHGLHQKGTPWYDGVPQLTQCSIAAGFSFVYEFTADTVGTHWYHSHQAGQASDGLYGAIIVLDDRQPVVDQHYMIVADYNHDTSANVWATQWEQGGGIFGVYLGRPPNGQSLNSAYTTSSQPLWRWPAGPDGGDWGPLLVTGGLINGKGRFYNDSFTEGYQPSTHAPLAKFNVTQGRTVRFRVVGGTAFIPWRISVDGHMLKVVASDGWELEPIECESFMIQAGERYDFEIEANQPIGNYYIRAESLERSWSSTTTGIKTPVVRRVEAMLHYDGASADEYWLTSTRLPCTPTNKCKIFNCNFQYWREVGSETASDSHTCLTINDAKGRQSDPVYAAESLPGGSSSDADFDEYFINWSFDPDGSANSINYVQPKAPPLTQSQEFLASGEKCDLSVTGPCNNERCICSNIVDIKGGNTIQMVLTSKGSRVSLTSGSHPIHIHGHSAYVLYTGFGTFDPDTALRTGDNQDFNCNGDRCNTQTWANDGIATGSYPSEWNLVNPPLKDTFTVPAGGYVVIRFKADNPGMWAMHCHMELHAEIGMFLALNESAQDAPPPPHGFPTCRSYHNDKSAPNHPVPVPNGPCTKVTGEYCIPTDPSGRACCVDGASRCVLGKCQAATSSPTPAPISTTTYWQLMLSWLFGFY